MDEKLRSKIIKALMEGELNIVNKLLVDESPKSLFKYRTGQQRDIAALKDNKVWLGRASFLDDDEDARLRMKNVDNVCPIIDIMAVRDVNCQQID